MPVIALVVSDLMFQSRIAAAAERLGLTVRIETTSELTDGDAAAVIVDLHEAGIDPLETIRSAHAAGARVLAFGRHTEPGLLRSARDAGAEIVVPRSQLVEELPELLRRLADGAAAAG